MEGPLVLWLDEIDATQLSLVGGKAFNLGRLVAAGLPVPAGFCLTAAAYLAFVEHNGWQGRVQIQPEEVVAAELPCRVTDALEESYARLGLETAVAVRSSASAEDSVGASFAGQYDTFLNIVGIERVTRSVKACWAGVWGERALAYRSRQGLDESAPAMGILIQQQVEARVAGVLFTLNPLTGREEETMIEAAWGLGQSVVSGREAPDTYVVHADTGHLLSHQRSKQRTMVVPDPGGGLCEKPLPEEWRGRSVLDGALLNHLLELGHRVQAVFGYPQDIEWALAGAEEGSAVEGGVALLQSRPLTSVNFDPELGQWASFNYREVLPGFASPLSISMSAEHDYGRALSEFFARLGMGQPLPGVVWGCSFFGRPYTNITELKRFAAIVPGYKERALDQTLGIEPNYEGEGQITPWTPRTVLRALPILLNLSRQYRIGWKWAEEYRDRFLQEIEPDFDGVNLADLSDEELGSWMPKVFDLHWGANGTAIQVTLLSAQSQDEFEPMLHQLNRRLGPAEAITESDLLTGLADVGTARSTRDLWDLALQARADRGLAAAVLGGAPEALYERLQPSASGRAFSAKLEALLKELRYMAWADEDLATARWDEDRTFALTMLQAYVGAADVRDPSGLLAEQQLIRHEAESRASAALSQGWRRWWPLGRRAFRNKLELVRRYVWWREELRVISAKAFYQCRRFFLELGGRWTASGLLREPDEIFLLRWDTIQGALESRLDRAALRSEIERYQRLRMNYRNYEPPEVIGLRGPVEERPIDESARKLIGTPCSSGQAVGRARVALTLVEAQALQRGEILVAPYANPSWMPLFNLAGGIVLEEGGLLSHGAVVAREYGIPTVLRIAKATGIFQTGQVLRVDGTRGQVELVEV